MEHDSVIMIPFKKMKYDTNKNNDVLTNICIIW